MKRLTAVLGSPAVAACAGSADEDVSTGAVNTAGSDAVSLVVSDGKPDAAVALTDNFAGHVDWRLPTAMELNTWGVAWLETSIAPKGTLSHVLLVR